VPEPSQTVLSAVSELVGPEAAVVRTTRLVGGTHARTTLLELVDPPRDIVLREFDPGDGAAEREAHVLQVLDGLDGYVPQVLGHATGADGSWVAISRLVGAPIISPDDPVTWARGLGRALARLHSVPSRTILRLPSALTRPGHTTASLQGPAAGVVAENWARVCEGPDVLTHSDFWSGNVLWEGDAVSGVVDWSGGAYGPPALDLGWCRLDLLLLYDERVADEFLGSYRQAAPSSAVDSALCDLWALARSHESVESWVPNYADFGRLDLTAEELRRRHSRWTSDRLAALIGRP
jgi:aminoglycoside phosphotransferase (APT) family kinase protein